MMTAILQALSAVVVGVVVGLWVLHWGGPMWAAMGFTVLAVLQQWTLCCFVSRR